MVGIPLRRVKIICLPVLLLAVEAVVGSSCRYVYLPTSVAGRAKAAKAPQAVKVRPLFTCPCAELERREKLVPAPLEAASRHPPLVLSMVVEVARSTTCTTLSTLFLLLLLLHLVVTD